MTRLKSIILKLNHECQFCITSIRLDYNDTAWKSLSEIIGSFSELISEVQNTYSQEETLKIAGDLGQILPLLLKAQKERDLCWVADIIENEVVSFIKQLHQETAGEECSAICIGNIEIEYNEMGEPILFFNDKVRRTYLTGRTHPFQDAVQYFYEYRDSARVYYALAGGCMIYDALAIMRTQIGTKVIILEENQDLVKALKEIFELEGYIDEGRISFSTENIIKSVGKYIREQTLLVKPSSITIATSEELKYAYSQYRMIQLSHKEEEYLLYKNFDENCRSADWKHVSEMESIFAGKQVYLIAGGPSLGKCFDLLRNRNNDNSLIMCVGTAAGKLINEQIDPEFVIISDPLPAMEKQLSQPFKYDRTTLIYACTTYSGAVSNFRGKKYIVFQKDFEMSESMADKNGLMLHETGGSVSTLALDILLRSGAKEIVCLGLDLAYTGNQMHVSGVDENSDADENVKMELVRSVSGDEVPTVQNLNSYRKWIVKRMQRYQGDIRVINLSDGAFIEGMENIPTESANNL